MPSPDGKAAELGDNARRQPLGHQLTAPWLGLARSLISLL
jgi:hypothetical protein